jgi:hypothetical protein
VPLEVVAELSAELGSLQAAYRQLEHDQAQREELAKQRQRDFYRGVHALDKLPRKPVLRERLPSPEETAASWPEPEVSP